MGLSKEKKGKGCLIGCLIDEEIVYFGNVIVAFFIFFRGDDIMKTVLLKTKDSISYFLSEDHSDEE